MSIYRLNMRQAPEDKGVSGGQFLGWGLIGFLPQQAGDSPGRLSVRHGNEQIKFGVVGKQLGDIFPVFTRGIFSQVF
jgi:hypothetical protein